MGLQAEIWAWRLGEGGAEEKGEKEEKIPHMWAGVLFLPSLRVAFIFLLDLPTCLSHSWARACYLFHMYCFV